MPEPFTLAALNLGTPRFADDAEMPDDGPDRSLRSAITILFPNS